MILCIPLVLNVIVRNTVLLDIITPNIPSQDQRPWYMKGETILPTAIENRDTSGHNLILPDDYTNNDRILQQTMLVPPSFNSISMMHPNFLIFLQLHSAEFMNLTFCNIIYAVHYNSSFVFM